jgi:hypothetical protein
MVASGASSEPGPPQYEQPMVSVRTRSGARSASSWETMPPIEMPRTWALGTPSTSSRPSASPARSAIVNVSPSARRELAPIPRLS